MAKDVLNGLFWDQLYVRNTAAQQNTSKNKQQRVELASNRLMGKLIEFAFDDSKPAAVQLQAIKDSLNRAGLKPSSEVFLSQGKPYEDDQLPE